MVRKLCLIFVLLLFTNVKLLYIELLIYRTTIYIRIFLGSRIKLYKFKAAEKCRNTVAALFFLVMGVCLHYKIDHWTNFLPYQFHSHNNLNFSKLIHNSSKSPKSSSKLSSKNTNKINRSKIFRQLKITKNTSTTSSKPLKIKHFIELTSKT